MSNLIYPKAKEGMLSGAINLTTDTVKAALVDASAYTYSATHQYLSDVPTRVADSAALTDKTVTNGQFDCSDPIFTAVAGGNTHEYVIFYVDSGTAGTSELLAFIDTATGLPVTTNGTDITVTIGSYVFAL